VVPAREAVEQHHAAKGAESAEKNRAFVGHRKREDRAEEWLAADHDGVVFGAHPPHHEITKAQPGDTATEGEPADLRFAEPHRLVHAVDRERRVNVPPAITGVAHLGGRVENVRRGFKLGEQSVFDRRTSH
jgi:hypothetical protein